MTDTSVSTRRKPGRKSNAERVQIAATTAENEARNAREARRIARYEEQEAKRAKPMQIDQKPVLIGWLSAVGVAFLTSAVISFNGITSVAPFVGLTADWMANLFFFFIEFMYLIFLVAYLLLASRIVELASGEFQEEATKGSLVGMTFFAGVAIAANAFHTFDYHQWDFSSPYLWAGVVLSVSAPVAILSVSKLASRVVFAKAVKP